MVLPLLLTAAYHSKVDIPGGAREARARSRGCACATAPRSGPHPLLLGGAGAAAGRGGRAAGDPDTARGAGRRPAPATRARTRRSPGWPARGGARLVGGDPRVRLGRRARARARRCAALVRGGRAARGRGAPTCWPRATSPTRCARTTLAAGRRGRRRRARRRAGAGPGAAGALRSRPAEPRRRGGRRLTGAPRPRDGRRGAACAARGPRRAAGAAGARQSSPCSSRQCSRQAAQPSLERLGARVADHLDVAHHRVGACTRMTGTFMPGGASMTSTACRP